MDRFFFNVIIKSAILTEWQYCVLRQRPATFFGFILSFSGFVLVVGPNRLFDRNPGVLTAQSRDPFALVGSVKSTSTFDSP